MAVLPISLFISLLASSLALQCLEMYCPSFAVLPTQRGNLHCDYSCLSPMCAFDSSDCQASCACSSSSLLDNVCEESK